MNAPLVSWEYLSSLLDGCNSKPSDDRYAQPTRGAFIINDFLQNPHFKNRDYLEKNGSHWQKLKNFDVP